MKDIFVFWENLKLFLESIVVEKDFIVFLNSYVGLSLSHKYSDADRIVQWRNEFLNVFNAVLNSDKILTDEALLEFEKRINITIYYWCYQEQRDCNFLAVVHYLKMENCDFVCSNNLSLRFTEYGILIFRTSSQPYKRFPAYYPVSAVANLSKLQPTMDVAIAKLRTIQREVCLLIEEWEHRNAVLAANYYKALETKKTEVQEQAIAELSLVRNGLACWCVKSLSEFQKWLNVAWSWFSGDESFVGEWDATAALLLAAMQKIYLPGSISRHIYANEVVFQMSEFYKFRLVYDPSDVTSLIAKLSSDIVLQSKDIDLSFLNFLFANKSYEWSFSHDPSSAVKAMSFAMHLDDVVALSALVFICAAQKIQPQKLDVFWFEAAVHILQMPGTFLNNNVVLKNESVFSKDILINIVGLASKILKEHEVNYLAASQNEVKYFNFLKQVFNDI